MNIMGTKAPKSPKSETIDSIELSTNSSFILVEENPTFENIYITKKEWESIKLPKGHIINNINIYEDKILGFAIILNDILNNRKICIHTAKCPPTKQFARTIIIPFFLCNKIITNINENGDVFYSPDIVIKLI
jgi:hypothetical protein